MNNGTILLVQETLAFGTSTAVSYAVNAEPLLTALITLGVSIVTLAGGEALKLIVAWLKKKREQIEGESDEKEIERKEENERK